MERHKNRKKHHDHSSFSKDYLRERHSDVDSAPKKKNRKDDRASSSAGQLTKKRSSMNATETSASRSSSGKGMAKLPPQYSDPYFPYREYRHTLNKIFFRDKDVIQKGTKLYDDFWTFLNKYQVVQQKASQKRSESKVAECSTAGEKEIFKIEPSVMKDMLICGHLFNDDRKSKLTEERLTEFQYIINLYLSFLEKEKATKLQKLKEAQDNLPIRKYRDDILNAVKEHQVVLVAGDTGCGKSTQVPQYLLAAGYESIACTQPRRIACISLCKRVAYETQNEYGSEIGYQIRFEKSKTSNTKILFLTEGLLLRQVSGDSMLSNYSVVILDEVHERHLPCDFLLGIMKCLAVQRPDVKIILMSATINIELFVEYFNGCPVIQVPGRLFPIQIQYCPVTSEEMKTNSGRLNPAPYVRVMNMINQKYPDDERGDLLIFLSGMTEISIVEDAAKAYAERTKKWIILVLHSTLSLEEQDKVFDIVPEGVRKCIISTNIAETSVTIDGVRFVVDSGKVKEMSYDPSCHMQRLQEFWISRASAEQRKGRAGRTGPGVCFRMYSEKDYDALEVYSKPEIQRVSLDSLTLQMLSLGLPDARKFPFLEPPALTSIEESICSLKEQGALSDDEELTPMGKMLSRLPVEVTIGKMLIYGSIFSLVEPVLSLAAALSVQSPFTNRTTRDPDIVAARQLLDSDHGDPFTLLNAYHKWLELKASRPGDSRKWCRKRGLEEQRFYEMSKLRKQFKELLRDAGLLPEEERFVSSFDRSSRHGELKHLKDMKRMYHQAPRKPKILKLDTGVEGSADAESDYEDEGRIDIKDVEFRMSHDRAQVFNLSSSAQVKSYRDIMFLKLIVTSGLYPRLAIPDIHNSYKCDSEQLFHTKAKPSSYLHPNGVFALQPDLLKLRDSDFREIKDFRSQTPASTRHQLVAYMSLLETTKPFLVNCLRVPAAHIVLLLSHSICTNQDFTRVVCDKWLELKFPNPEVVQDFVVKAWRIRDTWQLLLKKTFEEFALDNDRKFREIHRMSKGLLRSVTEFFEIQTVYCFRRLLAANLKNLFISPAGSNATQSGTVSHVGGDSKEENSITKKKYLMYNCLTDSTDKYLQYIQKPWTCPVCGQKMVVSVLDQIRHKEKCQPLPESRDDVEEGRSETNPLKKPYFCDTCLQEFHLTATEVLKHKRTHV